MPAISCPAHWSVNFTSSIFSAPDQAMYAVYLTLGQTVRLTDRHFIVQRKRFAVTAFFLDTYGLIL